MNNDFSIGFRFEFKLSYLLLFTEFLMVFNNAIVNHSNLLRANMRMSIMFCWSSMSGPPSMRNSDITFNRVANCLE